jgi:hypothetical protein
MVDMSRISVSNSGVDAIGGKGANAAFFFASAMISAISLLINIRRAFLGFMMLIIYLTGSKSQD